MNEFFIWSARRGCVALLQVCIALSAFCCDKDSTEKVGDCDEIGDEEPCTDHSGNPGYRYCRPDGTYSDCEYQAPEPGQSCSSLGKDFACECDGKLNGVLYCLKNRTYSDCFCGSASSAPFATAGSGGESVGTSTSGSCPEPFSCMQMSLRGTNNDVCVDASSTPPLCNTNDDCVKAGLEKAQCLDPGVGTKVCLQACEL